MAPEAAARPTRAELRLAAREQSRAQRRGAARVARAATRAALFRVAVPSVAALGVAGAAGITVVQEQAHQVPPQASAADAPDRTAARQAAQQAADADQAAQASRGDARQPLSAAQPTATPTAQPTAEPAKPKVVMPVAQHGLGELFGAAGTHWMNRHTGIDFPVDGGSEVYAVTDGTIRTQWNPFYGYMSILKMPDGTEAWMCHLRAYKVRKGPVKQGDVIAFVGSSGNSTGPHLHFEIRPPGSGPVDPLPWFLSNGLDPR
ncbi:M23 family metallopeptidase [Kitasatospora cathayae]|uniref:M23 family metallopeptidase n=1 Tax=Kitasatospora cathayae TaxID=3004092 RepID=A0ABY7Q717_9ACTN|nr:M23 family metallopeptidase [Kitasatospora sp. HUAS 3-15]WBP88459.1 M23 family metallopeptidase [Kitasatospora sp. HUAS 3-15]